MSVLTWIVVGGVLMALVALSGSLTLILPEGVRQRLLLPLVAFAAGALIGGALFFMLPEATRTGQVLVAFIWLAAGFTVFFAMEQFFHRHHCHKGSAECRRPITYLILAGDALHNLLDGVAVAGAALADLQLGITAWVAVAAHEVPQEIGDLAVLLHGGWSKSRALAFNVLSSLTFLAGGILTYVASGAVRVDFLVPFAAGAFLYIGASDLIPEVNRERGGRRNLAHFLSFVLGLGALLGLAILLGPEA